MGFRMRKSITICKGVRVNFGKTGTSLSVGTRGLRQTIHSSGKRTTSIGIPGTGISYVTSSGGNKRNHTSSAYATNQRIQQQKGQQRLNEAQESALLVEEYNNFIVMLKGIHKECGEFVDWNHICSLNEPFDPQGIGPKQAKAIAEFQSFKPNFFQKIIKLLYEKKKSQLEQVVVSAAQQDTSDYGEWRKLHTLAERILNGDTDAYFDAISKMNPLDELLEFGSDFEFCARNSSAVELEFKVKSDTIVPTFSMNLTQTGKLSKKNLTKTAYYEIMQGYVCSCVIRIARDIFASLPVNTVVVHAVDNILNTETGHQEDRTILSVMFKRDILNGLNFELINPIDAMNNFMHNMKCLKTVGFKPVERITNY